VDTTTIFSVDVAVVAALRAGVFVRVFAPAVEPVPACVVEPVPVDLVLDDVVDVVDVCTGGVVFAGGVVLAGVLSTGFAGDLAGWTGVVSGFRIGLGSAAATTGSASSSSKTNRADGRARNRISAMIGHLSPARKGGGP
jgi:hypothetical protein